ncbi:MAG: thiosulfate sulfurtransferase GlpE [Methylicorpusculum sp.]|uniref:thiosulfate sulfurtransferase GlpE n=1 Tax=Methylicorpusculum sp. TaxID=2713644 RepID=UPI00271BBE1F|nr:thiosulfate sulfurtransferase GlpE [Methylicorpusculum sp.]MDO8845079.1 thiosulfate sulfurtransferase GlpE [Methylicorpusculum sp.]MDO8937917.1 thiosulfate sulfurtransferase GlpE [Methylicorpusculum sp.]MDP2203047.1 thiosulfate sulfurtransferase GlpE [Methylicorpusculum sp.]
MNPFETIKVADAEKLIEASAPVILDCRDLKDYRAGHIDNAMHLHEQLKESLLMKGNKEHPVLIYCYYGHASEHLATQFCDFGFTHVYSLAGGYADWKECHSQTPST